MFELLLKKFLGFRQDWWPLSSTSLSHKLLSYLSPCHLWPSQLYSGFSWKKHLGIPCVVCVQSMWWCSKVLDLMLRPLQLICACAEATANISGCLAAKFGQTFCRVFFSICQMFRNPRQCWISSNSTQTKFLCRKEAMTGEHRTYISLFFSQGWFYSFV